MLRSCLLLLSFWFSQWFHDVISDSRKIDGKHGCRLAETDADDHSMCHLDHPCIYVRAATRLRAKELLTLYRSVLVVPDSTTLHKPH